METSGLRLLRPCRDYLASYYEACRETYGRVHDNYILHDPEKYGEWKDNIFQGYENAEKGTGLPAGWLPNATFWAVSGNEYVGTVNIRLQMNDALREYGGNVGWALRLSRRGQGLALPLARLAWRQAEALGVSPVLMTATESNPKSLHVLEKLPYKKKECATACVNGVRCGVRRYWF